MYHIWSTTKKTKRKEKKNGQHFLTQRLAARVIITIASFIDWISVWIKNFFWNHSNLFHNTFTTRLKKMLEIQWLTWSSKLTFLLWTTHTAPRLMSLVLQSTSKSVSASGESPQCMGACLYEWMTFKKEYYKLRITSQIHFKHNSLSSFQKVMVRSILDEKLEQAPCSKGTFMKYKCAGFGQTFDKGKTTVIASRHEPESDWFSIL